MPQLHLLQAVALAAAAFACCHGAAAKVVRLEITRTEPYGSFRVGDFVRIDGRVVGELDASEPIPGLDKVQRNARGRVEYRTPIVIIAPKESRGSNGALVFDVANRGSAIAQALYNSPRDKIVPLGSFEAGTGFLQDRGYTVVMAAWELNQKIELPHFTGPDGKVRYVEGVGLAVIRDVVDFLHHDATDEAGSLNPLAGTISRTIGFGYSQTARVLKTLLIEGFNRAQGRRVFDGLHLQASASGTANLLTTGTGLDSSTFFTPRFTNIEFRGVQEEPFTYEDIIARMVKRGEVPPKIAVTNMTTDYFSIRASLARTGSSGTTEAAIPDNVRIYDVAGASHGRGRGPGCELPRGELDWSPIMRAVLVALDQWVDRNRPPPASALMPLEARPHDESVLPAPSYLPNAVIQVPRQEADGNFIGGIRLPDVEVPLGVHGMQNRPLSDRSCNLSASYVAFAHKTADRKPGDTRQSVAERYKDRADYLNRIRVATRRLIEQRFLLPDDGAIIIHSAAQSPAFD